MDLQKLLLLTTREIPASGWLPCKMCGECLVEESTAESESKVASSSFASQSPKSDDRQKNIVDLCGRVQKRRKQQASPEIVVLLDTWMDQMKMLVHLALPRSLVGLQVGLDRKQLKSMTILF